MAYEARDVEHARPAERAGVDEHAAIGQALRLGEAKLAALLRVDVPPRAFRRDVVREVALRRRIEESVHGLDEGGEMTALRAASSSTRGSGWARRGPASSWEYRAALRRHRSRAGALHRGRFDLAARRETPCAARQLRPAGAARR
mgnify:CR=1 FL=1